MTLIGADTTVIEETVAEPQFDVDVDRGRVPGGLPGRYEDLGLIGEGGFGEVRRVRDTVLDRVVAMKLLHAEYARLAGVRRRFLNEAQITAQLQHPGIVAVYERGELSDGRLWFTMKEVRGRTLRDVLKELHASKTRDGFQTAPSGFTFRRVVDAFARIAQAMAYAHSRGIVHRDLKPENLMVGEFGEVLVMDWGLARRVDEIDPMSMQSGLPISHSPGLTHDGDILGTPAYMSPEQARGSTRLHGPGSDVYALGAVLYSILSGEIPYRKEGGNIVTAIVMGPPISVREAAQGGPELPDDLCAVCEKAMRRDIGQRYGSADALAQDVVAWLDGVRKREQALSVLDDARKLEPAIVELRSQAERVQARARELQVALKPFDSIDKKRPAWELEDRAATLGREAALCETHWLEGVHGALSIDPALPEAHELLADHYRSRLVEAELAHREEDVARAEAMLQTHDRGKHAAFLRGDGRLTLETDPPGAEVIVERFVLQDRRLVPVFERVLGSTPIREAALQRGSYLLKIRAPGRVEVRYPVLMERDGCWDGRAPGESEPFCIALPRLEDLGPDEVYVPAGFCWIGGDTATSDSLPRRRIWIDAFVMGRYPVTAAEYLDFLNDLLRQGREAEALCASPCAQLGLSEHADDLALIRNAQGLFELPPDRPGMVWRPDWPVVLVDWHAAVAYAQWLAQKTGKAWRLPNELEREKAARGVDGRVLPWGNHLDSTFARVIDTSPEEPSRESVHGHPYDESPYGIRGLAGNTRDWCINVWKHEGPPVAQGRLLLDKAEPADPDYRVIKGGAWASAMTYSRSAGRFGGRPDMRRPVVGIRVARTWTECV